MGFGRKIGFGKKQLGMAEVGEMMRQPDSDGVTRVFSKELWDDPRIGAFLRDMGMNPDDERNRVPTAQDYIAKFAAAKERMMARTAEFNRAMTARHGYCNAAPYLVIDSTIWDGVHGAFLYAQLDLVAYDEWNVIMLAADERTRLGCGIPGNPVRITAVSEVMTKRVVEWKRRYEFALETFGITATGGQGISREQFEAEKAALEREIVATVEGMKPRIVAELARIQG
jgi:hypothetical protein